MAAAAASQSNATLWLELVGDLADEGAVRQFFARRQTAPGQQTKLSDEGRIAANNF